MICYDVIISVLFSRADGRSFLFLSINYLFIYFFGIYPLQPTKRPCFCESSQYVWSFLLELERRRISYLVSIHFCVLKMFVHPDGASTTVPVTLQVKNVRLGPTQV